MKKVNEGSELRKRAELRFLKSGAVPDIRCSKEELQHVVQELLIHQIELEMQREELQHSRDQLSLSPPGSAEKNQ